MKKWFSVLGLAAAVLVVALALTSGYTDKAIGKSTCPSGTQKFARVCIAKKPRPAANFANASADCADEARRLPTSAELDSFRQQPGVTLGDSSVSEWSSDFLDPTSVLVVSEEANGSYFAHPRTNSLPYRCVK